MDFKKAEIKKIYGLIVCNEDKIILVIGFILVSLISFEIGRLSIEYQPSKPPIIINDSMAKCDYNNITQENQNSSLSEEKEQPYAANGKIIGNKKSMIYHVPDGKFYNTILEENRIYFNSEEDAKKAGYRKSKL